LQHPPSQAQSRCCSAWLSGDWGSSSNGHGCEATRTPTRPVTTSRRSL